MLPRQESPFVSMDEVTATTGLTERQVRYDVTHGYLPGEIDRRKRVVIRRGPWNEWLAGTWTPAATDETPPEEAPANPVQPFLRTIGKSA